MRYIILAADERRSCAVDVSTTPIHIMGSRTCGTKSHPWIVEAPVGQKINVSLLDFPASESEKKERKSKEGCSNYGAIVDKILKRNTTICVTGTQREKTIYLSKGNALDIYLDSFDSADAIKFILKLHGQNQCSYFCLVLILSVLCQLIRSDDSNKPRFF